MEGFIYVMSNPVMPGLVKVGMTSKMPHLRAEEISSHEGLPVKMQVEYYALVSGAPKDVEKSVHRQLKDSHAGKEWFSCAESTAICAIKHVAANRIQHEKFFKTTPESLSKELALQQQRAAEMKTKRESMRLEREARSRIIQQLQSDFHRLGPLARKALSRYDGFIRRFSDTFNPRVFVQENFKGVCILEENLKKAPLSDILIMNQYHTARCLLSEAGFLPKKGLIERELKGDFFVVPDAVIKEFNRRLKEAADKGPLLKSCYPDITNWYGTRR